MRVTPRSLGVLDVGRLMNTLEVAPRVEEMGFSRYWVSEHHGEGCIPTSTMAVTLVAGITSTIRIGAAGVLLRFQSALSVAQSFRTLQALSNGRVDLGVARANVSSEALSKLLLDGRAEAYSIDDHFKKVEILQRIVAARPTGSDGIRPDDIEPVFLEQFTPPPLWVLSTSGSGASLAARIGARYSFHDYYRPTEGRDAVRRYQDEFKPSPELAEPEWNVCIDAFIAENESEARQIRRSSRATEVPGSRYFAGTPEQFKDHLAEMAFQYESAEVILSTLHAAYDVPMQLRSFELAHQAVRLG